jgi:hypothetical protein
MLLALVTALTSSALDSCLPAAYAELALQGVSNFGVRDAVDEFAAEHGFRVYSTREDICDGFCPNWYLVKC